MNLVKSAELNTKEDLYLLVSLGNWIISNDGYTGIKIFDSSLSIKKLINFQINVTVYHVYKHASREELILYCPDDSCLIWVDLTTSFYRIISLREELIGRILSPAYLWQDDTIIFIASDIYRITEQQYHALNIRTSIWSVLDHDMLQAKSPELAWLVETMFHNSSVDMQLCENYIINIRSNESQIVIVTPTKVIEVEMPDFLYHDVLYAYESVAFVGETQIELVDKYNKRTTIHPLEGYNFLRAVLTFDSQRLQLITLSGGIRNMKQSLIAVYADENRQTLY